MKKPHYAWAICFACLLLYICNLGLCSNIFTVYLPFIESTGISHGAGCVYPSAILINKWFGTSTGLALGICSAGSGICSMLFSPIVSSLALHFSLRSAFLFQAAAMALCAVIVFVIIRDTPEEIGISPYIGRFKA